MRATLLTLTLALVLSSCAASDAPGDTVASAPETDAPSTTDASATTAPPTTEPTTTTLAPADGSTTTTTSTPPTTTAAAEPADCADPPDCSYAAGEDVCTDGVAVVCLEDPGGVYVNETIGFSFRIDPDWRRVESALDDRVVLVHRYHLGGSPYIEVSWGWTMGRAIDMYYDELMAVGTEYGAIRVWDWSGSDEIYAVDLAGVRALDWETLHRAAPQRNLRAVHPDPYSGQSVLIESFGSCVLFCGGDEDLSPEDAQWVEIVGLIRDSWTWLEPAERDTADCGVLGGGRYRVEFPAGSFGTTVGCSAVRGESYVFRVEVGAGQTLTATVTSVEDNAVFGVTSPSGAVLADERTDLVVTETEAGDYEIVVGSVRGNATFELVLDVR